MNFTNPALNGALNDWSNQPVLCDKVCAHNLLADERLSGTRGDFFEDLLTRSPATAHDMRRAAIDYFNDYVHVSRGVPHTFMAINAPAGIAAVAPDLRLIRVEDLRSVLERTAINASQLMNALAGKAAGSRALLEWFINEWNNRPDIRRNPCSFSAIKDQCLSEIADPNWPELLRNKFGLNHLDGGRSGEIPVALMEFEAHDILDQTRATIDLAYSFSIPTTLDSKPNAQFFPTPRVPNRAGPGPLEFGCPMSIGVILSPDDLIAEILHFRLNYEVRHLVKVGTISTGLPTVDFREMRNAHLWALRIEADRADYGTEL